MASSGPSAVVQGAAELDASGSACVNECGMASAGGSKNIDIDASKEVAANTQTAAAASCINCESPKPSTSHAPTSTSASSRNIVYDLVSVENTSEDSPAKLSLTMSEVSSMRECVSADSLLADLGITNMDNILPGQYESDSTDTPLISLSPYKVAGTMDLCDSDKCSGSDNNVRDLESLLKEAGIEEIKDEVVIVSKTSSGLEMIQVLDEDLIPEDLINDGKVLTVKADIECIPSNSVLLNDTPQDTPEHKPECAQQDTSTSHNYIDNRIQNSPSLDTHKKSNGIRKDVKQQPKGKNKPKLQKQLKFSDDDDENENYKNLKIIPRTSQYEKHPLLQTKTESGLSTIEALLLEHEEKLKKSERLKKHKSLSIEDKDLSHKRHNFEANRRKSVESYSQQMKFVPRSAQYERHPLLEKTESGLSELEQYLKEKEEEMILQEQRKRHSEGDIKETKDSQHKTMRQVSFPNVPEKRPSLGALTPRTAQYEKHPLLQSKDEETGLSEIEKFLQEKHMESMQEEEETSGGKEPNMANNTVKANDEKLALLSEEAARQGEQPRTASIKRVHFEKATRGTSEEIEELGSVQINPDERASEGQGGNTDPKRKGDKDHAIKDSNKCCVIL